MKNCLALPSLILLLVSCRTIDPSLFVFKQTIENKMPENIVLMHYIKEYKDSTYHLEATVKISANSVWDTTILTEDYNFFVPFGMKAFRDSVSLADDKGAYIRSYLNTVVKPESDTYCQSNDNLLCPENYAETVTKNDKRYRFVLE